MENKALQRALKKTRKDLHAIISNYAMLAFNNANKKKDGTYYKKRRPYVLPIEAEQAKELLDITYQKNISIEEEERIKAFLLYYRMFKPEYLINTDPSLR